MRVPLWLRHRPKLVFSEYYREEMNKFVKDDNGIHRWHSGRFSTRERTLSFLVAYPREINVNVNCHECEALRNDDPMKCYHWLEDIDQYRRIIQSNYPEWVRRHPTFLTQDVKALLLAAEEKKRLEAEAKKTAKRPIKVYLCKSQRLLLKKQKKEELKQKLKPPPKLSLGLSSSKDSAHIGNVPAPPRGVSTHEPYLDNPVYHFPESFKGFMVGRCENYGPRCPFPIFRDRESHSLVVAFLNVVAFLTIVCEDKRLRSSLSKSNRGLLGACAGEAESVKYVTDREAFADSPTSVTRKIFRSLRLLG